MLLEPQERKTFGISDDAVREQLTQSFENNSGWQDQNECANFMVKRFLSAKSLHHQTPVIPN